MLTKEAILPLVNARLNRVLLIAQAALPEHQFEAFRRLIRLGRHLHLSVGCYVYAPRLLPTSRGVAVFGVS